MRLPVFQIDAFASRPFEGNPAAVCPLEEWIDDALMQQIAAENNLSETAFFVREGERYRIRWFTPTREVDLCGHATLAGAYVLFELLGYAGEKLTFDSRSGPLHVSREAERIILDLPTEPPQPCKMEPAIVDAFGLRPAELLKGSDYIAVFDGDEDLTRLTPDFTALKRLDLRGVCVTARHEAYDFVSRFFAPNYGIDEDPVTGSAHTQLAPYWASRLKKSVLHAKQLSPRGGELMCELRGDRVAISGRAVRYLSGILEV